jgi:uncharacterized protein YjgD (DUF1641 family)
MAKQIEFRPPLPSAQEELQRRLNAAPGEHADAVLNAFKTLQTLHDTRTLDFVQGLFGAGDEVLTQVVVIATSPQSTRAIRNLLVLTNILGNIDPDALQRIAQAVTPALTERQPAQPPSLFQITRQLFSRDARRALATGVSLLQAVGRSLGSGEKV